MCLRTFEFSVTSVGTWLFIIPRYKGPYFGKKKIHKNLLGTNLKLLI